MWNGDFEEEVYIEYPEDFLVPENEDYVFRLRKAMYGMKRAPISWYAILNKYL